MHLMYHGTTAKNANAILRDGNFHTGTHFAHHMEDALNMGGDYVFSVRFDEKPTEYWEWRCPEPIPTSRVRVVVALNPSLVWHNIDCERAVNRAILAERYDDGVEFCGDCDGTGQLEYYPPLMRWRDTEKVTPCEKCGGYGVYTIDGSDIYEHKIG